MNYFRLCKLPNGRTLVKTVGGQDKSYDTKEDAYAAIHHIFLMSGKHSKIEWVTA